MTTAREAFDAVSLDVGLEVPGGGYFASPLREHAEMISMGNIVGRKLAKRYDWRVLCKKASIAATSAGQVLVLPDDFDRLQVGIAVKHNDIVLRPITKGEAAYYCQGAGTPNFYWLEDDGIHVWRSPSSGTYTILYVSKNWASSGSSLAGDNAEILLPGDLFIAAMKYEWRRQKGMDYAGYADEFEALMRQYSADDERSRF